jgi:subtilisin-like proprotein convertase family protein
LANGTAGNAFVTAYSGSFNPASLCANYIADGGSSSLAAGTPVTFSFTLAANQTVVLVVNEAVAGEACDSYTMSVSGINCTPPPPCVPPTSSVLSQVGGLPVATNLINETFDAVLPANWAQNNLSNPIGAQLTWFQGNAAVFGANSGTGYIAANFQNTAGTGTISNWLFAPNVTLKNGDQFSFYTRTTSGLFPDRMQVRLSTNGASVNVGATSTSVGDFTTLLADINPSYTSTGYPTAWTKYTFTMSGLPAAGVSGRIAFRYFVEGGGPSGNNSDYIGIDDVVYTTFSSAPVTVCTGSTANLKVNINGGNGASYNVTINANPGGNFTVNNYVSGSNIPVTPAGATTYTLVSVIQSDNPCCIGSGNSGTVTITPSGLVTQPLQITANPSTPLCAGDPTLLSISGAPATGSSVNASGAINVAIPDNNATGVAVTQTVAGIPGTANVTSVNVLFNITHTWDGDLTLFLKNPNNAVLNLVNGRGGSADNFTNTNISSTSAVSLASGVAPFTGTFAPDGSLSAASPTGYVPTVSTFAAFLASNPTNGVWGFAARDNAGGDVGTILNWTLTINYAIPAGPLPGGYSYFWSPSAGLSNTTSNPVASSPLSTTTYTVLGTAPNGCQTTASYTVNVNQLPAVTADPTNVTVCDGTTATFTSVGTGAGATFQWQVSTNGGTTWTNLTNGSPYAGVTTGTLTVSPATGSMNGYRYRMVVSGTCSPTATSASATLNINTLPVITYTPASPVCGGIAGVSGTQITAGSAPPPIPGSVTVSSGAISIAVPDNTANGVSSNLTVAGIPANATITGVKVAFTLPHTYCGDMLLNLKAPNNTILALDKYLGGTGNQAGVYPNTGFTNTVISSAGVTPLSAASVQPISGTFKPDLINGAIGGVTVQNPAGFVSTATAFSDLYSTPNGTWTLAMADGGPGDVGTLTSWSITIDYTTPGATASPLTYTWSPAAGLYSNATATTPYVLGTQTNTVYAAPTTYTYYTITGTNGTTGCVNTATVLVNYLPPAPTVVPNPVTMCPTDTAVRLTSSTSSTFVKSFTSGTINVPIPEGNFPAPPATAGVSTIAVSGIPANAVVTGVSVSSNITHAYVGDVVMVLKAPNNQIINLDAILNKTNNAGANFVNTVISSSGTTALSSGAAPFTGTFKADLVGATFSAFGFTLAGGPTGYAPTSTAWNSLYSTPNGNWTLATYDVGAPDVGNLTKWDLNITYTVGTPATPATWSPIAGLFIDKTATTPYAGDKRDTVWTKPVSSTTYSVRVNGIGPDATPTFANPSPITIIDGSAGSPYPSNITASGLPTTGVKVKNVIISGISHTWSDDIDIVLQSPSGTNVTLMSDVGSSASIANVTYTFDDAGPAMSTTAGNPTGTYHPTNNGASDTYPAPGPGAITDGSPALANFGSTANANGVWKLFVVDDTFGDQGNISGGYSITFSYPTDGCLSAATSVPVTVNIPVSITTQPVNAAVCTDKSTSFTVAAAGTAPTYQWQVSTDAGNTFTNISNGGVYSGVTTATVTITAPPVSLSGNIYRCVVTGAAPCGSVNSAQRLLTVNPLPTIVISASPYLRLFPGLTTTVFSTVTPAASVYTWFKNGATVSGATAGSLLVNVDGLGDYTLKVTDVNGCVNTSNVVSLKDSVSGKVFIYPNPNSGQFQVRYYSIINNTNLPRGINVYDATGKRVLTQQYTITSPYSRMDVNLSNYSTGVYWIEVVDVNGNRLAMGRAEVLR